MLFNFAKTMRAIVVRGDRFFTSSFCCNLLVVGVEYSLSPGDASVSLQYSSVEGARKTLEVLRPQASPAVPKTVSLLVVTFCLLVCRLKDPHDLWYFGILRSSEE